MLTKDKAELSTTYFTPVEVKVTDINSCDEYKELPSGGKIEYPYQIEIKDADGNVVSKEPTTRTTRTKDWNKKFYLTESGSGNQFVAYTRNHVLLALLKIKEFRDKEELGDSVNLNGLVGMKFEARVVDSKDGNKFIDWVGTFEVNGVPTPEIDDLLPEEERAQRAAVNKTFEELREDFNQKKPSDSGSRDITFKDQSPEKKEEEASDEEEIEKLPF